MHILAGMCGRYTNTAGPEELNDRFRVPIPFSEGSRRYNVAPTEQVLAIVAPGRERSENAHEARLLRWGLVPHWAEDLKGSATMINARMETVATRPAFRNLIPNSNRRALQLADGYFEWLKPEHPRGAGAAPRQPFFFQVDGGIPFAFAALWTPAKIDGEWIEPCTLRVGGEDALALCGALDSSRLSARPANPAVNKAGGAVEGPELLSAPA